MAAGMAGGENPKLCGEPSHLDDASLAIVADLVRLRIPSRDLVRLQLVSKAWRTWCSENAASLWKARKKDEVKDWYFPTTVEFCSLDGMLEWSGLHCPSEQEHHLPELNLPGWKLRLLASASGLLLLHAKNRSLRSTLIVGNPLTKTWRELPKLDSNTSPQLQELCRKFHNIYLESAPGVWTNIVIDDEFSHDYEVVIMGSISFICTYSTRTNQWKSNVSPVHPNPQNPAHLIIGTTYSNGRIYFLDGVLMSAGSSFAVAVRVYVMESEQWLPDVYKLHDDAWNGCIFGEGQPKGPTLVVCVGDVYAIVPVATDTQQQRVPKRGNVMTGTATFWVFKLQEEDKAFAFCAALPLSVSFRMRSSHWQFDADERPWTWYRCAAKGAVIWLVCGGLLLQFDVLTRSCKSQAVDSKFGRQCYFCNFLPYEPNFHINP